MPLAIPQEAQLPLQPFFTVYFVQAVAEGSWTVAQCSGAEEGDYGLVACILPRRPFFEHQCAAVHLLLPSASALTPSMWGLEVS